MKIEQGDILKVQRQPYPVIVASNNYFNETGKAVVCPIRKDVRPGPLHLLVKHEKIDGYILCEQVHYLDLAQRSFSKIGSISYIDVMDLSDAVMGIFDYQIALTVEWRFATKTHKEGTYRVTRPDTDNL